MPLVLTLNQFGGLAVNTSLILEKDVDEPYPWVCNWHDFENIIEILKYLHKGAQDFIDYLVWRIENHANVLSSDELDVIEGYFLDSQLKEHIKDSAAFFHLMVPALSIKYILKNMVLQIPVKGGTCSAPTVRSVHFKRCGAPSL